MWNKKKMEEKPSSVMKKSSISITFEQIVTEDINQLATDQNSEFIHLYTVKLEFKQVIHIAK